MTNLTDKLPFCPLCDKKMQAVKTELGVFYLCIRRGCFVSCKADDPLIPHWETEKLPCPHCDKPMKTFLRQDGYVKATCKCGFIIEAYDN